MKVLSQNPDLGEAKEEMTVEYNGAPLKIGFNARYLTDVLGVVKSDDVLLEMENDLSPGVVQGRRCREGWRLHRGRDADAHLRARAATLRVTSLQIPDFRNLAEVSLAPSPRTTILVGENGQGKTNLLEAIFFLTTLKPLRANRLAELIRFGARRALVAAEMDGPGRHAPARGRRSTTPGGRPRSTGSRRTGSRATSKGSRRSASPRTTSSS